MGTKANRTDADTEALEVGDLVKGGTTAEDYDEGTIVEVDGDQITVAWEGSNERTTQHASLLRR